MYQKQKLFIMETEKVVCKCGTFCMIVILGSLALGYIASFAGFIYLIFCLCKWFIVREKGLKKIYSACAKVAFGIDGLLLFFLLLGNYFSKIN